MTEEKIKEHERETEDNFTQEVKHLQLNLAV